MPPTMQHPIAVIARRNEPRRDRSYTEQESVRLPVVVDPEVAPQPVQYTTFQDVGLTYEHARPHRWLYQALAIKDKLSIVDTNGFRGKAEPGSVVVAMGHGQMRTVQDRANIANPAQGMYGDRAAVAPTMVVPAAYAKLI